MRAGVCALTNRAYNRGVDWERTLQRMLVAKGWKVIRSAGSHQAIDLVAGRFFGKVNRRLAIQCKTGEARFTEADKIATMAMAHHFNAVPMVADRKGRKRYYRILSDPEDVGVSEGFFD